MNYFLKTYHFFPTLCSHSKLQYIFFRKLSERYFILKKKKKTFFGPYNVWNSITTYESLKKLIERFTLITYNISFIFTYLLHSRRHSTLYMNARVSQ